ncbi:MAG: glycosyltransferase, partial [Clostridiales bacterium]|nr:glycosyltransferase [Clostridiales bacterium]
KVMSVGIVIPVYNAEKYLRKCLDSVCAQADCVKEIILVNDGSTDNSLAICKEYAQKDSRIKIIDKQNEGTEKAVIDGVNATSCEYVGFVDSDDYIEQDMFGKLFDAVRETQADIAFCDYDTVDEEYKFLNSRDFGVAAAGLYNKKNNRFTFPILPALRDGRFVSGSRWNKIIKRRYLTENVAFKMHGIRNGEDIALIIPVFMAAQSVVYVKDCLYHYVQRQTSVSHIYKEQNFVDWEKIVASLSEAVAAYNYKFDSFSDSCLSLLIRTTVHPLRKAVLTKAELKKEYRRIGQNQKVKELLRSTKIGFDAGFKKRIFFYMLNRQMYGLLASKLFNK